MLSGKFDSLFSASSPLESNKIGNKVKKKKKETVEHTLNVKAESSSSSSSDIVKMREQKK